MKETNEDWNLFIVILVALLLLMGAFAIGLVWADEAKITLPGQWPSPFVAVDPPEPLNQTLHREILYPTVRVRHGNSVGSGVIFASIKRGAAFHDTYVLTNHHVIESAISIKEEWNPLLQKMVKKETRATVEVENFKYQHCSQATGTLLTLADIQEWNKDHDLALLKLRMDERIEPVKLYPRGKENDLRVFMPVYICGSGLGRSPFPTVGVIASLKDEIDNQPFWMLAAPSVFGNSGGGAFLAESRQYIGVPSRLAVTWVGWSQNAVYHFSYIIPVSRVYQWLEATGWASLFDGQAKSPDEWVKEQKSEKNNNST